LASEDVAELKKAHDELAQESHKLAEAMYAKASQEAQAEAQSASGEEKAKGKKEKDKEKEEDVVDADFEEVQGDKA
jgi:molecular chaperone DnaK